VFTSRKISEGVKWREVWEEMTEVGEKMPQAARERELWMGADG